MKSLCEVIAMIYRDDCLIELPYEVKQIIEILEDAGYDTWLVGGSVRDALLKRPFNDYDIATASPIKATTDLLQNKGFAEKLYNYREDI